jgi:hypothetical protein
MRVNAPAAFLAAWSRLKAGSLQFYIFLTFYYEQIRILAQIFKDEENITFHDLLCGHDGFWPAGIKQGGY